MEVYEHAARDITGWNIYISKTITYYGVVRARTIYQKALKALQGTDLVLLGLRFAKVERKLNELARARAIYGHLAQYCNPAAFEKSFWKIWEQFELQSGDRDTYEDFLRARRTQELRYSVVTE
jgi:pre-mRNA-splicing factor SYF1